ncbi:hypothetical protein FW774_17045 [Pedobacter sp. BS3]|uniref:cyclic-phosphate processing receiver domain-containing protein n=1 Tax=Pedobacter sp. BS3 TaxID=2567937 RepID=UPI0011F0245E|nr:hypothetical protein FW774_17045 [Pedobacter sp. BS3]
MKSQTLNNTRLYLDDLRPIPQGFIELRSYKAFVKFISENGLPQFISFDHDLGEEKSGYDCAKWLVEYCLNTNLPLPKFEVHSQNPVGRENIEKLLYNFRRSQQRNQEANIALK